MRNFKNIAVASATALALTVSGTAVANAQTTTDTNDTAVSSSKLVVTSSEWGKWLNGDQKAVGTDTFGDTVDSQAPAWAKAWNIGLWTLGAGTVAGAILAGFNWLKHEGIII